VIIVCIQTEAAAVFIIGGEKQATMSLLNNLEICCGYL